MPRFDPDLLPEWPDFSFEARLWETGVMAVAGIDEAGRGAFAGPVFAGAVIFPPDLQLESRLRGVQDSKQMSAAQREAWAPRIRSLALAHAVGSASPAEIDTLGILPATRLAASRAVHGLPTLPTALLLDYLLLDFDMPQTSIVKGDARSLSIAAASILAKTSRDAVMVELDRQYPGYGFARHKGYGTAAHRQALEQLGPSPVHRISYRPVGALAGLPLFEQAGENLA